MSTACVIIVARIHDGFGAFFMGEGKSDGRGLWGWIHILQLKLRIVDDVFENIRMVHDRVRVGV